jgi:hypothetical protein
MFQWAGKLVCWKGSFAGVDKAAHKGLKVNLVAALMVSSFSHHFALANELFVPF